MEINLVGAFERNKPFGTEIAFKKGFDRIGGHNVTTFDPTRQDPSCLNINADVTMVFKCLDDWAPIDACKGIKVVYQPDDIRYPHIQELMKIARNHCDYALTYDKEAAMMSKNDYKFRLSERLLLTADNELYRPLEGIEKDIDFCFVGNASHPVNHASRRRVVDILRQEGYNVVSRDGLFDIEQIVQLYNRSKVVVNHATDVGQPFGYGYGIQCRHFEVGMTRTCLLSNKVIDDDGSVEKFLVFSNEEELKELARTCITYLPRRVAVSAKIFYDHIMKNHLPEHRAEQLVDFFRRAIKL